MVAPERPNVIARIRGAEGGPRFLWEGHLDTVQVTGMDAPFAPRISGGRLHGRGAVDDKGCVAAFMLALRQLAGAPPPGDVTFLAAMDEEYHFRGIAHHLTRGERYDLGIAGEPTNLRIVRACKGCVRWHVEVPRPGRAHGQAARGRRRDRRRPPHPHRLRGGDGARARRPIRCSGRRPWCARRSRPGKGRTPFPRAPCCASTIDICRARRAGRSGRRSARSPNGSPWRRPASPASSTLRSSISSAMDVPEKRADRRPSGRGLPRQRHRSDARGRALRLRRDEDGRMSPTSRR